MSDKKQSSIEWLANQSYELFEQYSEGNFDRINLNKLMLKATEQAKAMHKEEITKTYDDAIMKGRQEDGNEYYNETYGGNNGHI